MFNQDLMEKPGGSPVRQTGDGLPPWRVRALWLLLAGCIFFFGSPARAQPKPAAPEQPPVLAKELEGLLVEEPGEWLATLEALRRDPAATREKLLTALRAEVDSPRRWRLFHHLVEFGTGADIPLLLAELPKVKTPQERKILMGSVRALYNPSAPPVDLTQAVREFAFAQTKSPSKLDDDGVGNWVISDDEIRQFHRQLVPLELVQKLLPLRKKEYSSPEELGEAMEKRLSKEEWKAHGAALVGMVERRPLRRAREGLLRLLVNNPSTNPLLLQVEFEAWNGSFDPQPLPAYLYLEAGKDQTIDFPARLIQPQMGRPLRIDLRLREVKGQLIPSFQKLSLEE